MTFHGVAQHHPGDRHVSTLRALLSGATVGAVNIRQPPLAASRTAANEAAPTQVHAKATSSSTTDRSRAVANVAHPLPLVPTAQVRDDVLTTWTDANEAHGALKVAGPLVALPAPIAGASPLATRLANARAAVGPASRPRVTLAAVEVALLAVEARLLADHPRSGLEDLLEHPLDAFFGVKDMVDAGETWRDLFGKVALTQAQLNRSETTPVTLSPMPVSLYQGCLFPDAYFMRSTLYLNEVRGNLAHVGTFDLEKFTHRMPWVDLRGSHPSGTVLVDGEAPRLHVDGGSKQVLALLRDKADGASHITAYRGCARSEREVQQFIRDLLAGVLHEPMTSTERARIESVVTRYDDGVSVEVKNVLASLNGSAPRADVAAQLADMLGAQNQATFVGFDAAKAAEFQDRDADATTGEAPDVIVTYRLPLHELEAHVVAGTLFLGTEFDAIEAGFGDHRHDPANQATKFLLYRSLVDEG